MNDKTPQGTGRPQDLGLPNMHELWQLLEQFNKASLALRFPGWDDRAASSR